MPIGLKSRSAGTSSGTGGPGGGIRTFLPQTGSTLKGLAIQLLRAGADVSWVFRRKQRVVTGTKARITLDGATAGASLRLFPPVGAYNDLRYAESNGITIRTQRLQHFVARTDPSVVIDGATSGASLKVNIPAAVEANAELVNAGWFVRTYRLQHAVARVDPTVSLSSTDGAANAGLKLVVTESMKANAEQVNTGWFVRLQRRQHAVTAVDRVNPTVSLAGATSGASLSIQAPEGMLADATETLNLRVIRRQHQQDAVQGKVTLTNTAGDATITYQFVSTTSLSASEQHSWTFRVFNTPDAISVTIGTAARTVNLYIHSDTTFSQIETLLDGASSNFTLSRTGADDAVLDPSFYPATQSDTQSTSIDFAGAADAASQQTILVSSGAATNPKYIQLSVAQDHTLSEIKTALVGSTVLGYIVLDGDVTVTGDGTSVLADGVIPAGLPGTAIATHTFTSGVNGVEAQTAEALDVRYGNASDSTLRITVRANSDHTIAEIKAAIIAAMVPANAVDGTSAYTWLDSQLVVTGPDTATLSIGAGGLPQAIGQSRDLYFSGGASAQVAEDAIATAGGNPNDRHISIGMTSESTLQDIANTLTSLDFFGYTFTASDIVITGAATSLVDSSEYPSTISSGGNFTFQTEAFAGGVSELAQEPLYWTPGDARNYNLRVASDHTLTEIRNFLIGQHFLHPDTNAFVVLTATDVVLTGSGGSVLDTGEYPAGINDLSVVSHVFAGGINREPVGFSTNESAKAIQLLYDANDTLAQIAAVASGDVGTELLGGTLGSATPEAPPNVGVSDYPFGIWYLPGATPGVGTGITETTANALITAAISETFDTAQVTGSGATRAIVLSRVDDANPVTLPVPDTGNTDGGDGTNNRFWITATGRDALFATASDATGVSPGNLFNPEAGSPVVTIDEVTVGDQILDIDSGNIFGVTVVGTTTFNMKIMRTFSTSGLTAEQVRDAIGSTLVAGTNITIDVDDDANTVTINASGTGTGTANPRVWWIDNSFTWDVVEGTTDLNDLAPTTLGSSVVIGDIQVGDTVINRADGKVWLVDTVTATDFDVTLQMVVPERMQVGHVGSQANLSAARSNTPRFSLVVVSTAFSDAQSVQDTEGNGVTSVVVGDILVYDPYNSKWERIYTPPTGGGTGLDAEGVRDTMATALTAGSNITITPDDANDTITVAASTGDGEVTTAKLADLSVTNGKLANSAVTSAKIAVSGVSTVVIQDGAVTNAKLANVSINSSKIQSNAISTALIQDNAVTDAKLADNVLAANPGGSPATDLGTLTIRGVDYRITGPMGAPGTPGPVGTRAVYVLNYERNNPPAGTFMSMGNGNSTAFTGASTRGGKIASVYIGMSFDSADQQTSGTSDFTRIRLWKNDSTSVDNLLCEARVDFAGPSSRGHSGRATMYTGTLSTTDSALTGATEVTEVALEDGDLVICEWEAAGSGFANPVGAFVSVYVEEEVGRLAQAAILARPSRSYDADLTALEIGGTAFPWPDAMFAHTGMDGAPFGTHLADGIPLGWAKIAGPDGIVTISTSEPTDSDIAGLTYDDSGTATAIDYSSAHFANASDRSLKLTVGYRYKGTGERGPIAPALLVYKVASGTDQVIAMSAGDAVTGQTDAPEGQLEAQALLPPGNDIYYVRFKAPTGFLDSVTASEHAYYASLQELLFQ